MTSGMLTAPSVRYAMRIPKEVSILGHTWIISYKWNLTFKKQKIAGLCEPLTRTISIDRALTKEEKTATFMHEFMHAVLYEYQIGHNHHRISMAKEESLIEALESEILDKFKLRFKYDEY